jgi:integrase
MPNLRVTIVARVKQGGKRKWVPIGSDAGSQPYYVRYCTGSKPHYLHVGDRYDHALNAKQNMESMRRQGLSVTSDPEPVRATIADAARDYLAEIRAHKAATTWVEYARAVNLFVHNSGKKYLDEITRPTLLDFVTFLRGEKRGARRRFTERSVNHTLLKVVICLNAVGVPRLLKKADWPKWAHPAVKFYTRDQVQALLRACKGNEWLVIAFFLMTGMRRGEVQHVEVTDIDFVGKVIRVVDKPAMAWHTKTWENREIPIPDDLVTALRHIAPGFIFKNERGGMTSKNDLYHIVKRVASRVGIQADCHTFRRTFGTMWVSKAPIQTVQHLMGHRSVLTTMRYLGVADMRNQETRDRVASVFPAGKPELVKAG